jgi:hypothetical protein
MIEIIEGATAAAFGAADAAIAARVTQKLPGNLSMAFGWEVGGVLLSQFGRHVGVGRNISDPIGFVALGLLGARAARLGMAGKLFQPSQWGVGGEAAGGVADYAAGGGAPVALPASRLYGGARNAPGVRLLGRGGDGMGGSFALYPSSTEASGVAG